MKTRNFLIIIVLFSIILSSSCGRSKENAVSKQSDSVEMKTRIEVLNAKSDSDNLSNFEKHELERINIDLAKMKTGETDVDELLNKYKQTIEVVENYNNKLKLNPRLANDSRFIDAFQKEATTLRNYYQNLKNIPLNDEQEQRFNELSYRQTTSEKK